MRGANQARTLTFAERVSCQRAIEEVYWRHRIWPKERADPKPSLDAVMTQRQLERKVSDYLRNSQALEDYWQRPITPDQLQREMERMASHTKQPGVLREIFEALGNDPFVIAECLARPALAERLLTTLYAHDQRFHGELKRHAEVELQTHRSASQMKQTSGMYTEMEWIKGDSTPDQDKGGSARNAFGDDGKANRQSRDTEYGITLNSREWNENVQKLAKEFGNTKVGRARPPGAPGRLGTDASAQIKTGVLSPLREDEGRYYATVVVKKTKERLKLATVEWRKEPLESWRARAERQMPKPMTAMTGSYTLPTILAAANGCTDDTWATTATDVPTPRFSQTAVWTGSEMIVWGGIDNVVAYSNTGGRYDPATDNWRATSTTSAPDGRTSHTAVWTGDEMIVWGGTDGSNFLNTGGRYDPTTDSWTATSTTNAPSARGAHTAVWTGSEMIVWGGGNRNNRLNTGGRYSPVTDSWEATSTANAPSARYLHTAVWTGSEMIVWGGGPQFNAPSNTGGRYNPSTNSWIATSTSNAPSGRQDHTAVWTGSEMIVWGGGPQNNVPSNTGGRYNPNTNSWTATSSTNAPTRRSIHTAVWTGSEMIIWGGLTPGSFTNTGGKYNPSTNSWTATSTTNAPSPREFHAAVWTGSQMIVWGGGNYLNTGGRYNPTTNSWRATATLSDTPGYTAVWTGSEMIVWGGTVSGVVSKTGARYNPSTDSWSATSITHAPAGRENHTAVWTGDEMIIWGGFNGNNDLNTGGRYNPISDTWIATSTTNAPSARTYHTAVWTGSKMIVWGGEYQTYPYIFHGLNTGGRYNPITDSWTAATTTNAPAARYLHTAVWTGSEMIVWGGFDGNSDLNTGGRYNPGTNSWTATSTTNAPSGRGSHTAVWTGSEMIVWGGFRGSSDLNTGGRYNPGTDSWAPTSTTNAPSGRGNHTAVWTGSKMIIWGGEYQPYAYIFYALNTGGRYNPISDSWIATSTTNAPSARADHTAVWTGSEMIIWGGIDPFESETFNTGGRYCVPTPPAQLANISTRAFVQTGDNVMIGGFIVQGTEPKRVIIRAIGPELTHYGVPNVLANPTLELHDRTGALIASNDNWRHTIIGGIINSDQRDDIRNSGYAPADGRESAIISDLPAGNYTAIVRGVNNAMGVALVEVYDLSPDSNSILANISTRSFVQTGDNVIIGGFIVQGTASKLVIVRAIGPELTQYGVPNAMVDPTLELHDSTGALIASNDNWRTTIIGGIIHTNQVRDIRASGLAPGDERESAIIAELPAGNYTAILRGVSDTTGVALVEVYDLD
jgi:N-acetylneuraminic acid mutarotase